MIRAEPRGYPGGVDTLSVEEPWYGWDSEEADNGWLLTYVDVLSVILAMMVVLLGRMSVEQLPSALELQDIAEAHDTSLEAVSSSARDDGQIEPSPSSESIARTSPSTSKEERFNALVTQRFPGEATAVQQEHGVSIVIPDVILFESARANLQDSARPMLARLVTTLKEIGEADVSVEGHTDSRNRSRCQRSTARTPLSPLYDRRRRHHPGRQDRAADLAEPADDRGGPVRPHLSESRAQR